MKVPNQPATGPDLTCEIEVAEDGQLFLDTWLHPALTPTALRLIIIQLAQIADRIEKDGRAGLTTTETTTSTTPIDRSLS